MVPFIEKSVLNELREIYPDAVSPEVVSLSDGLSLVKEETGQKSSLSLTSGMFLFVRRQ